MNYLRYGVPLNEEKTQLFSRIYKIISKDLSHNQVQTPETEDVG